MMSDGFRKLKISLFLRGVHICLIHSLKAKIFVYLRMYGRNYSHLKVIKGGNLKLLNHNISKFCTYLQK